TLLAELQHRVRNTLAVVRSIARRTADNSSSVEDYRAQLDGRLDAFSRVQAMVTRDPAGGVDLEYIVSEELRPYGGDGRPTRTKVSGPRLRLQAKAAETMALAAHELATNAAKYGALSGRKGRVDVTWAVEGDQVVFEWIETGGPAPAKQRRHGLGTDLIERTLRYDLDAETSLDFPPTGLRCRIALPYEERLFKAALVVEMITPRGKTPT
ncbi:MAG: sensor histidine kinase, partial [Pseudolabrys sp.]|nr:sensor histidine kinase [Pseudolabrys sp.]